MQYIQLLWYLKIFMFSTYCNIILDCVNIWDNLLVLLIINLSRTCKCMIWCILILFAIDAVDLMYSDLFMIDVVLGKLIVSFCYACKRKTNTVQDFYWHFLLMYFLGISYSLISIPKVICWKSPESVWWCLCIQCSFPKTRKPKIFQISFHY